MNRREQQAVDNVLAALHKHGPTLVCQTIKSFFAGAGIACKKLGVPAGEEAAVLAEASMVSVIDYAAQLEKELCPESKLPPINPHVS